MDALCPAGSQALRDRANRLLQAGEPGAALALLDQALEAAPDDPLTLTDRGNALQDLQRPGEAVACYERALEQAPDFLVALANRGNALRSLGQLDQALASLDAALRLQPQVPELWNNRGSVLRDMGSCTEALADFERALDLRPGFGMARVNCGKVLLDLQRPQEALAAFETALRELPQDAEALFGRGQALLLLESRYEQAVADFERAAQLGIDRSETLVGQSTALAALKRHREAAACLRELLRIAPDSEYAPGSLLHSLLQSCAWDDLNELKQYLAAQLGAGRRVSHPQSLLSVADAPELQRRCAQIYGAHKFPATSVMGACPPRRRAAPDRIRVAYVSADFRDHPVAYLLAGVLERHDRTRFEVIGISLRTGLGGPFEARVRRAFDRCIDVAAHSDRQVAERMRALSVDIAVDLMGYTQGMRLGIFAHRAAPVQAVYLGYAGTLAVPYIDYLLGDAIAIPAGAEVAYAESVVRLPHCLLPNDDRREIGPVPGRSEAGLPADAFVFGAFTNAYKISPAMFDVWMRLLRHTPGSVLWLGGVPVEARRNLGSEAARRGVAAHRLLYAERTAGIAQHLARQALADLCLDTLPYNAHSTVCDALWVGVPILTCAGRGLAGRIAASALAAAGLPELVTHSLQEYEALGRTLAATPALLGELRQRLRRSRQVAPLFDTARSCRNLESAYQEMQARAARGEAPRGFTVMEPEAVVS